MLIPRDLPPYGRHGEEESRKIDEMFKQSDLEIIRLLSIFIAEIRKETASGEEDKTSL